MINTRTKNSKFLNFTLSKEVVFEAFSLCGLEIPKIVVNTIILKEIEAYLAVEGLLNPEDNLLEEMKCDFYKQMIHGIIWDLQKKEQSEVKKAA
jgi:hypothetical protein